MRVPRFYWLVVGLVALMPTWAFAQTPILTEIYVGATSGGDRENNFIEIANPTTRPIDLTGWRVVGLSNYANGTVGDYCFPLSGTLAPGAVATCGSHPGQATLAPYLTPHNFQTPNAVDGWNNAVGGTISFNYNGQARDGALLIDPCGAVVDWNIFGSGSTATYGPSGSFHRNTTVNTPHQANTFNGAQWATGAHSKGVHNVGTLLGFSQPTALVFSGITPTTTQVAFTAAAAAANIATATHYLVLRGTGAAPTFTPANYTQYVPGTVYGDATCVFYGTGTSFTDNFSLDNCAQDYYYVVYAAYHTPIAEPADNPAFPDDVGSTGNTNASCNLWAAGWPSGAGCIRYNTVAPLQNNTTDLAEPTAAIVTPTATTQCGGTITLDATGGTGGTMHWQNTTTGGTSTATPSNQQVVSATGTYYFRAVSAAGCWGPEGSATVTIHPALAWTVTGQDEQCGDDGAINITFTAGTPDYSITVIDPLLNPINIIATGASANFATLPDGTYQVSVEDANGCTQATTVVLANNDALASAAPTLANGTCGLNNGSIDPATATGGDGTYTYTLAGPGGPFSNTAAAAFTGLAAGTYTLTVSDGVCTDVVFSNLILNNGTAVTSAAPALANGNCGLNNGSIDPATATGGDGTYTYTLAGPGGPFSNTTAAAFTGLATGTYTLTASDGVCTDVVFSNLVINNGTAVTSAAPALANGTCGLNNGSIDPATATGGDGTYTYTLAGPGGPFSNTTAAAFTGLAAGMYSLTVSDGVCTDVVFTNLVINNGIVLASAAPTLANGTCGLNNGSIDPATATGGDGTYTYTLAGPGGPFSNTTAAAFTGLAAGTFTLTVSDGLCTDVVFTNLILNNGTAVASAAPTVTNGTCGLNNGSIDPATATGGDGTYTYTLAGPGGPFSNTTAAAFTGLAAGTYTLTVSDGVCTDVVFSNLTIDNGFPIATAFPTITNGTCGNLGSLVPATPTGGSGTYTFQLDGPGGPYTTLPFNNLAGGTYTLTVSDGQCADAVLVNQTVTVSPAITQTSLTVVDETCDTDGTAILVVQDATAPLVFEMFNALNVSQGANATGEFTGVSDGTYTITATDGAGCVFTTAPFIIDPGQPTVWNPAAFVLDAPTCNGGNDGNITVQATSLNPVAFNITPGGTFNNLAAGTYVVTAIGTCPSIDTTLILTDPAALVLGTQTGDPTCANGTDGGIQATVTSGGTAPYNYVLLDGTGNVADANNNGAFNFLPADAYTVNVTDANGCTATATATLLAPAAVALAVGTITPETCAGTADGRVELNVTGGQSTYQFAFVAPDGTPISNQAGIFFDLAPGTYTAVQVTDGCGNTATAPNFSVGAGASVSAAFTANPNPATVPDGVVAFTPTAPNPTGTTYTWLFGDGTPTLQNPAPQHAYAREGTYTVQLFAALGTCADTATLGVEVEAAGIFIPTVFTPNGDGSNDDLTVIVPTGSTVRMLIFDRWGNELATLTEPVWRPEAALPESVYVLHLEVTLPNGTRLTRASSVTLIR